MTDRYFKFATCPLCGTETRNLNLRRHGYIEPRYTFDLYSTNVDVNKLNGALFCCDNCGYVFADGEEAPEAASKIIATKAYKTCEGQEIHNMLLERYYKYAIIHLSSSMVQVAFYDFLFGAWFADVLGEKEDAVMFRKKALELYGMLDEKERKKEGFFLVRADILRRCREFDKVIEEYSSFQSSNDDRMLIARIQVMLAKDKDDKCYYLPEHFALMS